MRQFLIHTVSTVTGPFLIHKCFHGNRDHGSLIESLYHLGNRAKGGVWLIVFFFFFSPVFNVNGITIHIDKHMYVYKNTHKWTKTQLHSKQARLVGDQTLRENNVIHVCILESRSFGITNGKQYLPYQGKMLSSVPLIHLKYTHR